MAHDLFILNCPLNRQDAYAIGKKSPTVNDAKEKGQNTLVMGHPGGCAPMKE